MKVKERVGFSLVFGLFTAAVGCAPALPVTTAPEVTAEAMRRTTEGLQQTRMAADEAQAAARRSDENLKEARALLEEARRLKASCDAALMERKRLAQRKIIRRPRNPVDAAPAETLTTTSTSSTTTLKEPEYSPSDAPVPKP